MNKTPLNEITEEVITGWKAKFKKVTRRTLNLPDELVTAEKTTALFYICAPSHFTRSELLKALEKNDVLKSEQLMIKNCVLGGDIQYLEDQDILAGLIEGISDLMQAARGVSEKA